MMRYISDQREPKTSGYDTIFGECALARTITQTQAAKISEGSELEKILIRKSSNVLDLSVSANLEAFLGGRLAATQKNWVISKRDIKTHLWPRLLRDTEGFAQMSQKECESVCQKYFGSEPDMAIFDAAQNIFTLIELKSYCVFDTEKAAAIYKKLKVQPIRYHLPFKSQARLVCFHAPTRVDIVRGLKKRIRQDMVMTGAEFLEMISTSTITDILAESEKSQEENILYLLQKSLESAEERCNPEKIKAILLKFAHLLDE